MHSENNYDWVMVEVSSNNGDTWQTVTEWTGTNTTWTQPDFSISQGMQTLNADEGSFQIGSRWQVLLPTLYVDECSNYYILTGTITGIRGNNNSPYVYSLDKYPNPFKPGYGY